MKKILLYLFFILMLPLTASAAVGDVAGNVYSTDIKAYVDEMEIQSYCLEGKTAIPVEALRDYGFDVIYNNDTRTLLIERKSIPQNAPDLKCAPSDLPIGSIVSHYYKTDIKTYMDGYEIPSYALDGFTIVAIEDLTQYNYYYKPSNSDSWSMDYAMHRPFNKMGFYHIWDNDSRTIKLTSLRGGFVWQTELGDFLASDKLVYHIKKAGTSPFVLKASIADKEYNWYLLKISMETYGLEINPKDAEHLYINSTPEFLMPTFEQYDQGYFMEYEIIAPVMSKKIIINDIPYYAENMFLPIQNYLYVREDLFEKF